MKTHSKNITYTFKQWVNVSIAFCMLLIFSLCAGCRNERENASPNIVILDSLLKQSDELTLRHLTQIAEIKQKKRQASNVADKYLYTTQLFENYYTLNVDSALKYADKAIELAETAGNPEWITHSLINKATILSATGLLKAALDIMDDIDPTGLSQNQLVEYYGQMVYLYSHLGNYAGGADNEYYVTERLYKDSVMQVITPSHPEYLWYKSWDVLGTKQDADSVINALVEYLDKSQLSQRQDAKNAYALARLYEQKGDMKNYEKYMALSAIVDVKIANSEIASLEDLSKLLFNNGKGDIERAYSYMNYSLDKALNYPNRNRAFGIADSMHQINQAYQKRSMQQQKHTKVFLVLVCILAGILVLTLWLILKKNKQIRRQKKKVNAVNEELSQKVTALSAAESELNEMNSRLKSLNDDLKAKNDELNEANFVKEEYIGYVFNLCSTYIAKIEELKRNIYLKVLKKQYKDIENETSDLDMKEELKDFYRSFDTIFLTIYPNFVADFNSLLKPEKQIVLKDGEIFNMELRIYALIKLGIGDSVKIADFLHCAPQTVYNYRLRARSRSLYDKEEFLNRVKSLGSFGT